MNCTNCGASLPDNSRFCDKCGNPVAVAPAQNAQPGYQPAPTPGYQAPQGMQNGIPANPAPAAKAPSNHRLFVKIMLGVALLCFFLPFVTISCNYDGKKEKLATYQGIDLLFGEKYENDNGQGADEYGGKFNLYLWAAFGCTIAALVLAIKKKDKLPYILSGVGAFAMLIFRFSFKSVYDLDSELIESGLKIDFKLGFYLSLLLMIAATVLQWFAEAQEKIPGNMGGGTYGGERNPQPQMNIPMSQMGGQPGGQQMQQPDYGQQMQSVQTGTGQSPIDLNKQ